MPLNEGLKGRDYPQQVLTRNEGRDFRIAEQTTIAQQNNTFDLTAAPKGVVVNHRQTDLDISKPIEH